MIGTTLKNLRVSKGLSMQKIADALNVPKGTYVSYEYGQREPNLTMIDRIATYYGITTDYLLGREFSNPLDQLIKMSTMNVTEETIVEEYLKLPSESRQIIINFLKNAIKDADAKEQKKAKTPPVQFAEKTYPIRTAARRGNNGYFSSTTEDMTESEIQELLNAEDADEDL